MIAILSAPGSRGDVNPMIAIGRELRHHGIDVVITLAENYAHLAEKAGLRAEPAIESERFKELLADPGFWRPIAGPRLIMSEVAAPFVKKHLEIIDRYHRPGETVLVSHPLDLASRVYREVHPETPLVDVHLAPSILRTIDSPPRLSPWWFELSKPRWAVRMTYWLADTFGVDPMIRGPLNAVRAEYGLPPVRRILDQWWLSPDRIVAMYPDWFAPATKQFSPRLVHTGFPLDDADDQEFDLPDNKPIVFTGGTAHLHTRPFFETAVETCIRLDRPGLLVSTSPENFPPRLPEQVRTTSYVPFGKLLPHCAAIVHHGGIGTTSQALLAGIPQVIRPLAYDQFDNASRVESIGCGRWLRRDADLTSTLRTLLDESAKRNRCQEYSEKLSHGGGAAQAAEEVLRLAPR